MSSDNEQDNDERSRKEENSEENLENFSSTNLSTVFKNIKEELENIMESESEKDQKKNISELLSSIQIPYTNKTCPNYFFDILEMLRKKKKLESFINALRIKNNTQLLHTIKESFLKELNVLSGIKKENSSLNMIKFIVGFFLYQLKAKDQKKLENFFCQKNKVDPSYIDKIIAILEKNANIFSIYICGLSLSIKSNLDAEKKKKLGGIFTSFLVQKIFDDEEREKNLAKMRVLAKFLNNISEEEFYNTIISNCGRLLSRSSKNYGFFAQVFINVTKIKYKDDFIKNELFEEYKSFFFPTNNTSDERDIDIYQSFQNIANNCNISLLLEQILNATLDQETLFLYSLNYISIIFKIYATKEDTKKKYPLSDTLITSSILYVCQNFNKIYKDDYKTYIENFFESFLSSLYALPQIKIDQNKEKDTIEQIADLTQELINNNTYSSYHSYFYLIPAVTIKQFGFVYNENICDLFSSLLEENYNADITEKNVRNMLPLTTSALALGASNDDFKSKSEDKLNKVFSNLISSDLFINKYNELSQIDSICLYLICQFLAKGESNILDEEENKKKFLNLLSKSLFKASTSNNEIYVFKQLVNILIENKEISDQFLQLIFYFVLKLNDSQISNISFRRVAIFLDKLCEKYFVPEYINNIDEKIFLQLLILIHIPNMYLDINVNNHRSHNKNMFIEKFYREENKKNLMISNIEKNISTNICQFIFSKYGLFNKNNITIVNSCYALIAKIFKETKASKALLENSFGLLKYDTFKEVSDKLNECISKIDYKTKYELIDIVNDLKKNGNKYLTKYDIQTFLDTELEDNKKGANNNEDNKDKDEDKKEGEEEAEISTTTTKKPPQKKNKPKKNKNENKPNKAKSKKNPNNEEKEIRINEEEYKSFIINFHHQICNQLLFMLNRLKPLLNLLNELKYYNTKENIKYVINIIWSLLKIDFCDKYLKRCLLEYFKGNDLSKKFSVEFSEIMLLEAERNDKAFNDNYNENQILISKLNKKLIEIFNEKENDKGKKYMNDLFHYFDFIIVKLLFYIVLNKNVLMDDVIESVENLISILTNLKSLNYEDISMLLVPLLKSNYYGENLKVLLGLYFKNASEKSFISLFKELFNYEYISKFSFLNSIIKQNMESIKKYQFIHYKIYILCFEDNDNLSQLAKEIWKQFDLKLDDKLMESEDFKIATQEHKATDMVNRAIRDYVTKFPKTFNDILGHLINFYESEVKDINAQKKKKEEEEGGDEEKEAEEEENEEDEGGDNENDNKKKKIKIHDPQVRKYLFLFINETLNLMDSNKKKEILDFFLKISDEEYSKEMFEEMNNCIFNLINSIPENDIITKTLKSIKDQIVEISKKSEDEINYNNLYIIMMMINSVLVRIFHDDSFTKERETIFDVLLELSHHINDKDIFILLSKNIQYLSADIPEKAQKVFDAIIQKLSNTKKQLYDFGDVYVLSGLIKCFGVSSYKEKKIDEIIIKNMEKKSSVEDKQNAMYTIKIFFETMKKLFEPYFVEIFEQISTMISNREKKVRETAQECFKGMMKELSGYGVDKIMPNLIKDLHTMNSKGKIANIEILGQFAYCAPKQLSIYIPKIIKEIMKVLTDPQKNVQETAADVLNDIASTIKNPEIVDNSDILVKSIQNPFENSRNALEMLMETQFYHYLDPPSLALIIPIIDYNLKSQNDELKRMSAHVLGSIQVLIQDQNDLIQYMDIIVPDLQIALFDSNPDCRNEISKAVGALTKSLGAKYLTTMFQWLEHYLETDVDTVQRSGAAQGYAEILVSFNEQFLEKNLMRVINKIQEGDHIIKEGYLSVFVFLPGCLGDKFEKYFELIFPLIIEAFSDEHEKVRNVSNKVFEICIKIFARRNTTQLIEPLLERLFSENWRIRNSSIALIKTLINSLGKEFSKEQSEYFKKELRDKILTYTFILKSDLSGNTSTIANIIWRDYVDNIPKYLSRILVDIYNQLMALINDEMNEEIYMIATQNVKLLATKFSDKFFNELLPIIKETIIQQKENEYISDSSFIMISVAVSEISERLLGSNRNFILKILYENIFTDFSSVRKHIANIAYSISIKLNDHNLNRNLVNNIMKQVRGKSEAVQKKTLEIVADLVEISKGEVIRYVINEIFKKPYEEGFLDLGTMISTEIVDSIDDDNEAKSLFQSLFEAFVQIPSSSMTTIVSITSKLNEEYLDLFIEFLEKIARYIADNKAKENAEEKNKKDPKDTIEFYFSELISNFLSNNEQNLESIYENLVEIIIGLLYYDNEPVIKNVGGVLKSLVEKTDKTPDVDVIVSTLLKSFSDLYEQIKFEVNNDENKFNEIIGGKYVLIMEHLLFTLQNGLIYGENKLLTCKLINDIIQYCPRKNLRPFIMKMIGPIIRVLSEKISPETKEKLMENTKSLIIKVKEDIKGISTQLQSVFVKTLTDSSNKYGYDRHQMKAGENIILLLQYSPKIVDIITNELIKNIQSKIDQKLGISALFEMEVLGDVIRFYGAFIKPDIINRLFNTVKHLLESFPQVPYEALVLLLSSIARFASKEKFEELDFMEDMQIELFKMLSVFNGDAKAFDDNINMFIEEVKTCRLEKAITYLSHVGKIINKYRCYMDINEKVNSEMMKKYQGAVVSIFEDYDKLKHSNEKCDANLCLFFVNLGYIDSYKTNKKFAKNVFSFLLQLMGLSKVNLQLLISCLSLILLKKVVMNPDKDEIIKEVHNITEDPKDIEILESFLNKIYFIHDK